MTTDSLDVLLVLFGASLLLHVQFELLLPGLHTDFSRGSWSGIPISFRIFQFIVIHTVKGFGRVNKAEIDVFLDFLAFSIIQWMLAIQSLVPLPFLKPA